MALKLSIFTTATNPIERGDDVIDALLCYQHLADEVIVVDGTFQQATNKKWHENLGYYKNYDTDDEEWVEPYINGMKREICEWPKEFDWPFIGQQFQRGYEAATGDWIIHADLDFLFHENDFAAIRQAIEHNNSAPALSFWKYQFVQPDRYNLKSRLVIAVNKGKYGDRIKFNSGGDLCQPSLDGKELKPDNVPESKVAFYNYEKLSKTKEQIIDDVERMDRAYQRHFGRPLYSNDERSAYDGWVEMVIGRYHKPAKQIKLKEHPKYIQDTIRNLRSEHFGYNAFGILRNNSYVENS